MTVQSIDIPIIGGSNKLPQDDPQYTLNMYAEKESDTVYTLKPTPGNSLYLQWAYNGAGRGEIAVDGRLFGIRGGFFQEVVAGSPVLRGQLSSTTGKVGLIASSPANGLFQILIVDDDHGYVFELATNTFTLLTGAGGDNFLGGGSQVAYCAGTAFVFKPGTNYFQCSGLFNFLTWDTTANKAAFTLTTPITALASNGDLLYVFSSDGFELWQDQGLAVFPLSRILSGDKIGILAPHSALFSERYCYWLGRSSTGQGVVYRHSGGGEPERISDHSNERNIAEFQNPADAIGWTYQSLGHTFYGLNFIDGNRTLVYDKTTGLWADRLQREPVSGALFALPWVSVVIFNSLLLALDYRDGKIWEIDDAVYTDNGNPIIRGRDLSVVPKEADFLTFYQSAELFGQIGNTSSGQPNPNIMMSYSTDRGMTWSFEDWQQAGGDGTYAGRTRWVGLGAAYGIALRFRLIANSFISWRMVRLRAE